MLLSFFVYAVVAGNCDPGSFCFSCGGYIIPIVPMTFVIPFVFLFSLITYRMRNEVFEHWMKFAKWATPTTIVISFLLSVSPRSHNIMSGAFEAFILFLTLGIFCIVSLWRIIVKYWQLKH